MVNNGCSNGAVLHGVRVRVTINAFCVLPLFPHERKILLFHGGCGATIVAAAAWSVSLFRGAFAHR